MILQSLFAIALVASPQTRGLSEDAEKVVMSSKEAQRTMQRYSDCIVKRSALDDEVEAFLRQPADSPASHGAAMKLVVPACMPRAVGQTEMRMQGPLFRGAIYEAMYRDRFAKRAPDFAAVPPLELAKEFDGEPAAQDTYFRVFGDCVARQASDVSHRLLLSSAGSAQESAALAAAQPTLGICLPKDQTLKFSRPVLRGIVAEAMVKLSAANQASTN